MPRTVKPNKPVVNWTYQGKEITSIDQMPEGTVGFVYRITNHDTDMYYIGRKTVAGNKKKRLTVKEKKLPENNRKTFKYEFLESPGWKSYVGSNAVLKEEAKKGHRLTKEILVYCMSKARLTFEESKAILCGGALEDNNSYNGWITCKIYKNQLLKV